MMKRFLLFVLSLCLLFSYDNVFAQQIDLEIKEHATLSVYYTDPVVGEKPADKARFVLKKVDGTVVLDEYLDIFWYICSLQKHCAKDDKIDMFEENKYYRFDITDSNKNNIINNYFLLETRFNGTLIPDYLFGVFITPLPSRKYDNKSNGLVQITDISLDSKSSTSSIVFAPSFNNLDISFGFKFANVDDFVKYKVTIKNNDNKDYTLTNNSMFTDSEYMNYDLSSDDGIDVIKAGTNKVFNLTVSYRKEVPEEDLTNNGVYSETNKAKLVFAGNNKVINPNTSNKIIIIFGILFLMIIGSLFVKFNNKEVIITVIIISIFMFVPLYVRALDQVSINVEADVKVQKSGEFCAITGDDNCSYTNLKLIKYSFLPNSFQVDSYGYVKFNIDNSIIAAFRNDYLLRYTQDFDGKRFNSSNFFEPTSENMILDPSVGCYLGKRQGLQCR